MTNMFTPVQCLSLHCLLLQGQPKRRCWTQPKRSGTSSSTSNKTKQVMSHINQSLRIFILITTRRAIRLSGKSPVHSAADRVHVQCLELLVEKGFDVNALLDLHISEDYRDMRKSALYFTVSNGDVTCTEMLLNTGDKPDLAALFCLVVAMRDGQYEIAKLLLARHADINCYFSVVSECFPQALQYCLG
ncbi:unnamed protein product [Oncorhynchus mykiss]|uniref:Uncharacterized protein n=1 Tax=Oncorhynchus mykiss TaxID=8022 RepID=A0A060W454_ONCMY|nr:unnamed protein product [Oncorhynchus mykiss]